MLQIFWGFIFLLFDINASIYSIDVLPDFIGWILIVCGFVRLSDESNAFIGVKIIGIIMALASAVKIILSFVKIGNTNLLDNAFWGLKLIVLTITVYALITIRDRINDFQRIKIFRDVWLAILIIEILTFLYGHFIADYFPYAVNKAIMQILVVGIIFLKIWLLFCVYKIKKALREILE